MIAPYIQHGTIEMATEPEVLNDRAREIPSIVTARQSAYNHLFKKGACLPGYPTMPIVEREIRPDGPVFQYRLVLEGLPEGEPWREIHYEEDLPEEGWDTIGLTIYTADPDAKRWQKGSCIENALPLYDVSATAADSKFRSAEHGLITGQAVVVEYVGGVGGVAAGGVYYVFRINANQFWLAASKTLALLADITAPGAPVAVTGSAVSHRIAWTAHGLSDGAVVLFPELTGGAGLTAAVVPYYVVNSTTDDFQVALTAGGEAVAFTTNVTAGTCRTGTAILITSDGDGLTLACVQPGFETCWIVDRRKRRSRAQGYWEVDLQLKGLKQEEADSKPIKRRISTTSQTVSNDKYPGGILAPVYQGWPPVQVSTQSLNAPLDPGYMALEMDLPQLAVTDTFVSDVAPPTWLVPGCWIPDDAPAITLISSGSDAYTYHWPAGWKVLNLQTEQIPGKPLWLYSITWGYQNLATPRTAPA